MRLRLRRAARAAAAPIGKIGAALIGRLDETDVLGGIGLSLLGTGVALMWTTGLALVVVGGIVTGVALVGVLRG